MKTAISLPDDLFQAVERLAKRLGVSRSELYRRAVRFFLRDHKEFKLEETRADKEGDFIKRQIRYEMVTAAYGVETAYQVLLETDLQMQRAVAEIPKARIMAEDMRRLRSSRDGEPRRN